MERERGLGCWRTLELRTRLNPLNSHRKISRKLHLRFASPTVPLQLESGLRGQLLGAITARRQALLLISITFSTPFQVTFRPLGFQRKEMIGSGANRDHWSVWQNRTIKNATNILIGPFLILSTRDDLCVGDCC